MNMILLITITLMVGFASADYSSNTDYLQREDEDLQETLVILDRFLETQYSSIPRKIQQASEDIMQNTRDDNHRYGTIATAILLGNQTYHHLEDDHSYVQVAPFVTEQ